MVEYSTNGEAFRKISIDPRSQIVVGDIKIEESEFLAVRLTLDFKGKIITDSAIQFVYRWRIYEGKKFSDCLARGKGRARNTQKGVLVEFRLPRDEWSMILLVQGALARGLEEISIGLDILVERVYTGKSKLESA